MGTVPVLFTCQSPGQPDADRKILFHLMQIITYDNKEKANHKADPKSDIQVISQIIRIKENINAYGKHRDDPEDHFANAGIDIFYAWDLPGLPGKQKAAGQAESKEAQILQKTCLPHPSGWPSIV